MHHSIECDVKIRQNNTTATVLVLESNRVSKSVLICASETKRKNEKLSKKKINFQMINFKNKKEKYKRKRELKVNRDQAKRLETFAQHTQSYTKIIQYKTNGNIRTLTRDDSLNSESNFYTAFSLRVFLFLNG